MNGASISSPDVARVNGQDDEGLSLVDVSVLLIQHRWLLILAPLLVGILTLAASYLIKPTFTAKTLIMPPQQQQSAAAAAIQSLGMLGGLAGAAGGLKSPADQYVALMQSQTVSSRIIDAFKLMPVYKAETRQDAIDMLARRVQINVGKKDGLIGIEVEDTDPQRAAAMANSYVKELSRLTTNLAITEAQQRRMFFEGQLRQTHDRLVQAQRQLQGSGINEGALRAEPRAAAETYALLKAQVTAAEVRLQSMRGRVTEQAPEHKMAVASLAALQSQLRKAEVADDSAASGDYIGKYREFKYQEVLFELFSKQFELAKVDESREGVLIQIVDTATVPELKSNPKRSLMAVVATIATEFVLLVFLFIRHMWQLFSAQAGSESEVARLRNAWKR